MTEEEFLNAAMHREQMKALAAYEASLTDESDRALKMMRAPVPNGDVALADAIAAAWLGAVTGAKDAAAADFGDDPEST